MNALFNKIKQAYTERFGASPLMIQSPGRVNLIGEHTDYNDGFVLPAAIDKVIYMAMGRNNLGKIRLLSVDMDMKTFETPVSAEYQKVETHWANYILGVVNEMQKAGYNPGKGEGEGGFDCVFGGTIPIGAGLSSSAALEGGIALGLNELFQLDMSRKEMALISQRAENLFVGVQSGIMDQFANLHGKKNSVIKLDCRTLDYERYPFEWNNVRILLCDTKVRRELAGSEYNVRRQQCEEGVAVIKKSHPEVKNLRDVSFEQLEEHKQKMDPVVYRRCRYVLEENRRLLDGCEDLMQGDLEGFGKRMYQSHYGLKNDYEVSCEELDILVEAVEPLDGVLGARMMGGGFGGCTINLVALDKLEEIKQQVTDSYKKKTGIKPDIYVANIGEGTHIIKESDEVRQES